MSGTGVAPGIKTESDEDILVTSILLIPPLPYSPTLYPAEKMREAIIQVSRERRAKEREAAQNGSSLQ